MRPFPLPADNLDGPGSPIGRPFPQPPAAGLARQDGQRPMADGNQRVGDKGKSVGWLAASWVSAGESQRVEPQP